jgi:hypothetical protein
MRELGEALVPYMSMSAVRASQPSFKPVVPVMKPVPRASPVKWIVLGVLGLAAAGVGTVYSLRGPDTVVVVQPPAPPQPPPVPVEPPKPPPPVEPPPEVKNDPPPPVEPPPVKPPPNVKPVKLTPALIQEVVAKGAREVRKCIDRHQTDLTEKEGKVSVRMTVELSGEVKAAQVMTPGLKGTGFEGCVLKEVKRFKFPKHLGPAPTFDVPFNYKLSGG